MGETQPDGFLHPPPPPPPPNLLRSCGRVKARKWHIPPPPPPPKCLRPLFPSSPTQSCDLAPSVLDSDWSAGRVTWLVTGRGLAGWTYGAVPRLLGERERITWNSGPAWCPHVQVREGVGGGVFRVLQAGGGGACSAQLEKSRNLDNLNLPHSCQVELLETYDDWESIGVWKKFIIGLKNLFKESTGTSVDHESAVLGKLLF